MTTLAGKLTDGADVALADTRVRLVALQNLPPHVPSGSAFEFTTDGSGDYSLSVEPGLYDCFILYDQLIRVGRAEISGTTITLVQALIDGGGAADPEALGQYLATIRQLALIAENSSVPFKTIADGLAATPNGELFLVVGSTPDIYADLYLNDGGTEDFQRSIQGAVDVSGLEKTLTAISPISIDRTDPDAPEILVDLSDYYTSLETDDLLDDKQATLVSGVNIKTINGGSILGSGDIVISGGGFEILHMQDQKTANTSGGMITAGSFVTRTLNTVLTNTITGSSLTSNEFTLPAGDYWIYATCPAISVASHKARLHNVTDATSVIIGTSERAGASDEVATRSVIAGSFTLASSKVLRIEHRVGSTSVGGLASNFGVIEVYTDCLIRKVG